MTTQTPTPALDAPQAKPRRVRPHTTSRINARRQAIREIVRERGRRPTVRDLVTLLRSRGHLACLGGVCEDLQALGFTTGWG